VEGPAAQAHIDELQRQLVDQHAEVQALQEPLSHAVAITPDKQDEFATVAQAEGVSLSVARRLSIGLSRDAGRPVRGRVVLPQRRAAGLPRPALAGAVRGRAGPDLGPVRGGGATGRTGLSR
jgi:hypothetical protein